MRFQSINSVVFPSNSPLLLNGPVTLTPTTPGPLIIPNIPVYEPFLILDVVALDHYWGIYLAVVGTVSGMVYNTFNIAQTPNVVTQCVSFITDPRDTSVSIFWNSAATLTINAQSSAANPGIQNPEYCFNVSICKLNAGQSGYLIPPGNANSYKIFLEKLVFTWANFTAYGQIDVNTIDGPIASIFQNTPGNQFLLPFNPHMPVFVGNYGIQVANNGVGGIFNVTGYWRLSTM